MTRVTYYSPVVLGTVVTLTLHQTIAEMGPLLREELYWPFVGLVSLAVGILCQFLMFGAQGAFAQVLPVPGGRSIRGRGAVVSGGLLIAGIALAVAAGLLASEEVAAAGWVLGTLALAALGGSAGVYAWCWPAAVRDFAEER